MPPHANETQVISALRALVIGAGPMAAAVHLPFLAALRDRGEIALAVICDLQSARAVTAQHKFGFEEHTGDAVTALTRIDIDVVYIFGSAHLHHTQGSAALQNGKHLFVEKPIAPSYRQAMELAVLAARRGLVAVGGHNRRFYQALAAVRGRAGGAGWRFAEAVFHKPEHGRPVPFGASTWLGANGIHALDALVYMMGGLPAHLTAYAGASSSTTPSAFSALMRWPDGAQGTFLCNNDAGVRREEYVFHGPGETCRVDGAGVTIEKGAEVIHLALPTIHDGFAAEHEAFIRAIRTGGEGRDGSLVDPSHRIAHLAPSLFLAELIEAGYSGPVVLPSRPPSPAPIAGLERRCLLVDNPAELLPALERHLSQCRTITLADLRASPALGMQVDGAFLGRGAAPLAAETLACLPHLSIVGIVGLSLARHTPDVLLARNVTLVNAGRAHADCVAEFALGLAILGRRRGFVSHEVMRAGGWGVTPSVPGFKGRIGRAARAMRPVLNSVGLEALLQRAWHAATRTTPGRTSGSGTAQARDLRGATVGLLGWGANARAFADRLVAAGARVVVYSEHAGVPEIEAAGAHKVSLREALAAEIVSLHRGLSAATRHFLGAAELTALRPGAVLINVARGALIEPDALVARLRRGDIFACLDTYDIEPLAASHSLRRLPNVFLTSHIAGGSRDMNVAAADEVAAKIAEHFRGNPVDALTGARLRTMT